MDSAVNGCTN